MFSIKSISHFKYYYEPMWPAFFTAATLTRCYHPGIMSSRMSLSKVSLQFDFNTVPYSVGIHHIHSPEKMAEMHGLGAPFFKIDSTQPPNISTSSASISFACSTFFMQDMHVRMFTAQPDVSNMLFFKDRHALYRIKLSVIPLKVNNILSFLCLFPF